MKFSSFFRVLPELGSSSKSSGVISTAYASKSLPSGDSGFYIRNGIVVVVKNATIANGTII